MTKTARELCRLSKSGAFSYFRDRVRCKGQQRLRPFNPPLGHEFKKGLLLSTSNDTFAYIVPWLLLGATGLFAIRPRLVRNRAGPTVPRSSWIADAGILAVAVYGSYFNGGLGILLLATLGALGHTDMGRMNGIKNFISAILTLIAVIIYAASGAIVWTHALWMALGATFGGYGGGIAAGRLKSRALCGALSW